MGTILNIVVRKEREVKHRLLLGGRVWRSFGIMIQVMMYGSQTWVLNASERRNEK